MRKARGVIFGVMFCVNIGLTAALIYLFVGRGYYVVGGFTSVEVVTIVLAALGVILTALGFFIAMLAIWGYQSLNTVAENTARAAAKIVVKSELPAMLRRELEDQAKTENVLGETTGKVDQSDFDSLDGDKK